MINHFRIYRVILQFPFSVFEDKITMSYFTRVIYLILAIIYASGFVALSLLTTNERGALGPILVNIPLTYTFVFIIVTGIIAMPIFKPGFWINFYQKLFFIDQSLENIGACIRYNKIKNQITWMTVGGFVYYFVVLGTDFLCDKWVGHPLIQFLQFFQTILATLVSFMYANTLFLRSRFEEINKILSQFYTCPGKVRVC